MKRNITIRDVMNFDDILLVPAETQVKPADAQLTTRLTSAITLGVPVISAPHAPITESTMAIAMARLGGLGIIHAGLPLGKQVEEVRRVKRAQSRIIASPITVSPDASVAEAMDLMATYGISGLPVIAPDTQEVAGIITARDVRFFEDYTKTVRDVMSHPVITAPPDTDFAQAKKLMHENRVEKLVLVDKARCVGMITARDIAKQEKYPQASLDSSGMLRAAAAVGTGKDAVDRAAAMADAGLDVVFVDAAHAHTKDVVTTVSLIRQQRSTDIQVIAGNVATAEGARSLMDAGADAVKVGIGGEKSSASRRLSGVGLPQLTALLDVVEECGMQNIPVILDGGVHTPADFAKAIAAGADAVVFGDLFAHTDETPHAPAPAVPRDAYQLTGDDGDFALRRGSVTHIVSGLAAGLKTAMAYTGQKTIRDFHDNVVFAREK